VVRTTLAGLRREYAADGTRPVRRRAPLLTEDLRLLLSQARETAATWVEQIAERRDSALLLLGQPGAFRRSELVALDLADVVVDRGYGLFATVRRSKTDQTGQGLVKALPFGSNHQTCPACAYARWREVLDAWDTGGRAVAIRALRESPPFNGHVHHLIDVPLADPSEATAGNGRVALFRGVHRTGAISPTRLSPQAVNPILARRATAAGLPASVLDLLGGHSLRAGFVTQAKANGADNDEVMRQTGHTNEAMVRQYTRHHLPQQGNAVARLGL
jgi:integrase